MPGGGTLGEEPTQWVRTLGETCRKASESSEDEGIDGEFGGLAHDQRRCDLAEDLLPRFVGIRVTAVDTLLEHLNRQTGDRFKSRRDRRQRRRQVL